ncbi:hypothetical protein J4414_02945 [Candidatus Woesearchaeota archaeon]|nr:hypothetical protein [Candidatus Woesearchaeota archaeon]
MGIEFILDERLRQAREDLEEAKKILDKKEDKNAVFMRRLWFACIKASELDAHKEIFKEKIHVVQKEIAKPRLLPPPPKPVTKLVSVSENNG